MIIKCTNCSGALTYDAATGKMLCKYCGANFLVEDINVEDKVGDTIECDMLTCTTCGAELSMSTVETASFCAYCGQPTIVFDRVGVIRKPKKIIPFSVTKSQAVDNIRKRFKKGFFIPEEIKNFEVERVTGIYIPYWLYDVYYYDKQTIQSKSGKHTYTHYREAEADFKSLTVDASSNFANESSQRLEPYDTDGMKEFNEAYLSGFYADNYDQSGQELEKLAISRCQSLFDSEMKASVSGSEKTIEASNPKCQVKGYEYAMLPAWFMTMRYEDKPYTMIVNGQTGKTVGAVPIQKKKVISVFLALLAIFAAVCIPLGMLIFDALLSNIGDELVDILMYAGAGVVALVGYGMKSYSKLRQHIGNTTDTDMKNFAVNRQKGD